MAPRSSYTEEKGNFVCEWIATGRTLNKLCLNEPGSRDFIESLEEETEAQKEARTAKYIRGTVYRWFEDIEGFREKYERARTFQWEVWSDEIIDIGDDKSQDLQFGAKGPMSHTAAVQRSKLRTDDRKWLLSKLVPKQFGDKPEGAQPTGNKDKPLKTIILNVLPVPKG